MSPEGLDPVDYGRVENVRITPGVASGTRRARALRVPVRVPGELQTSKARDRPYRQVDALVIRRS